MCFFNLYNIMELNYEVNGIKYLLFELIVTNKAMAFSLEQDVLKYNGILQSYDTINSFWDTKVKAKVLIPESNAIEFSKSKKDRK